MCRCATWKFSPFALIEVIEAALIQLNPDVTDGSQLQVSISNTPAFDSSLGVDETTIRIRYRGANLINADVDSLQARVDIGGTNQPVLNESVEVRLGPEQFNPQALRASYELNTRNAENQQIYGQLSTTGSVSDLGFESVGAVGPLVNLVSFLTPSGGSATTFNPAIAYDVLAIPVRAISAGSMIQVSAVPSTIGNGIGLYGTFSGEETVLADQVELTGRSRFLLDITDEPLRANDDAVALDANVVEFAIDVLANDQPSSGRSDDDLTLTIQTAAEHGTVAVSGGQVRYTPNAGYLGFDSFEYTVSDSVGGSATATVRLTVSPTTNPVNAADVNLDGSVSALDAQLVLDQLRLGPVPREAGTFNRQPPGQALDANGDFTITVADVAAVERALIVAELGNEPTNADAGVVVRVDAVDAAGQSLLNNDRRLTQFVGQPFFIEVSATDLRDEADRRGIRSLFADIGISQPGVVSTAEPLFGLVQTEGTFAIDQRVSRRGDSSNAINEIGVVDESIGTAANQPATTTLFRIPVTGTAVESNVEFFANLPEGFGTDTILRGMNRALRGQEITFDSTSRFVANFIAVPPPTAADLTLTVDEDSGPTPISLATLSTFFDGPATFAIGPGPTNGTAELDGDVVRYTPNADFFGPDSFTFSVTDGVGSATGQVTINVLDVVDPPIAADDMLAAAAGRANEFTRESLLANDFDGGGTGSLTIESISAGSGGGTLTVDGPRLVYQPAGNFTGTETFTYTVTNGSFSDSAIITVNTQFQPESLSVDLPGDVGLHVRVQSIGGQFQIFSVTGDALLIDRPVGSVTGLTINGTPGNDILEVRHDAGSPIFNSNLFSVTLNGGDGVDRGVVTGRGASDRVRLGMPGENTPLDQDITATLMASDGGLSHRFLGVEDLQILGALQVTVQSDQILNVGGSRLVIDSMTPVDLSSLTRLAGGTIDSSSALTLGAGESLLGFGTINAEFAAATGSSIQASGDLTIGDAASPVGFVSDGQLMTGPHVVTLNDSDGAVLRGSVVLGGAEADGTLAAAGGLTVDFGARIAGRGLVETPNDVATPVLNNGVIQGGAAAPLTVSGLVKGVGRLDDVTVSGTFSPGFSPTVSSNGAVTYAETSTLLVELGGTEPGSGYDRILHNPGATLGGQLAVRLIDNFIPAGGLRFDILEALESFAGNFRDIELPELPDGLTWETIQTADGVSLEVILDALQFNDGIVVEIVDGRLQVRRGNGQLIPAGGQSLTIRADRAGRFTSNEPFRITGTEVVNGDRVQIATAGGVTLRIRGAGWTNYVSSADVNGSGDVSALDALQIINELNRGRFSSGDLSDLPDPAGVEEFPNQFYDTSRDGRISALDALRVINELNRLASVAQTEPSDAAVIDQVFARLPNFASDPMMSPAVRSPWSDSDDGREDERDPPSSLF